MGRHIHCGIRAGSLRLMIACLSLVPTNSSASLALELEQATQVPIPVLPLPPVFHFSDSAIDREYYRLQDRIHVAREAYGRSSRAAYVALRAARQSRVGSTSWLGARDAIQIAIRDARAVREALQSYVLFLSNASRTTPADEARIAIEDRRLAQDSVLAVSDSLVNLLALLAGIRSGLWPA